MALSKYKIGDLIVPYAKQCNIPNLTINDVSGINRDKEFFEPSKQVGFNTNNYKVVPPNYFACNLMHVGRDMVLPVALNHSGKVKYVSPAYSVFYVKENMPLLKQYFFVMLKSDERDRYFWFHTDSSVRDGMSWEDMCDIELRLPPLEVQQKYVDIYNAMLENQRCYERGLDDLKLVCDAYIEELRRRMKTIRLESYISPIDERNKDLSISLEQGITIEKEFATPKQVAKAEKSAKIVRRGMFAYNRATTRNGEKISIAYRDGEDCVVSSAYQVFEIKDETLLLPEYLMMWFKRKEFDRYARFMSKGSAHEFFEFDDMCDVEIPIPDISVQRSIANVYKAYTQRKQINERLKAQIKDICPILIKGSIDEARA